MAAVKRMVSSGGSAQRSSRNEHGAVWRQGFQALRRRFQQMLSRTGGHLDPGLVAAFEQEAREVSNALAADPNVSPEEASRVQADLVGLLGKVREAARRGQRSVTQCAEGEIADVVARSRSRTARRARRRAEVGSVVTQDPSQAYRSLREALSRRPPSLESMKQAQQFLSARRRALRSNQGIIANERDQWNGLRALLDGAVESMYRGYMALLEESTESNAELLKSIIDFVSWRRDARRNHWDTVNERILSLRLTSMMEEYGALQSRSQEFRVQPGWFSSSGVAETISDSDLHNYMASSDIPYIARNAEHHSRRHERLRAGIQLIETGFMKIKKGRNNKGKIYSLFYYDYRSPIRDNLRIIGRLNRDELRFVFRVAAERAGMNLSPEEIDAFLEEFLVHLGRFTDRAIRHHVVDDMKKASARYSMIARAREGDGDLPAPNIEWLGSMEGRRFLLSATAMKIPGASRLLRDFDRLEALLKAGRREEAEDLRSRIESRIPGVLEAVSKKIDESAEELASQDNGISAWQVFATQFPDARNELLERVGARPGSVLDRSVDVFEEDVERRKRNLELQFAITMVIVSAVAGGGALSVGLTTLINYIKDSADVETREAAERIMQGAVLAGEASEAQHARAQAEAESAREARNLNLAMNLASGAVGHGLKVVAGRATGVIAREAAEGAALQGAGVPVRGANVAGAVLQAEERLSMWQNAVRRWLLGRVPERFQRHIPEAIKLGKDIWKISREAAKIHGRNAAPGLVAALDWKGIVKKAFADKFLGESADRMTRLVRGLGALRYLEERGLGKEALASVAEEILRGMHRTALSDEGKQLYDAVARYRAAGRSHRANRSEDRAGGETRTAPSMASTAPRGTSRHPRPIPG